MTKKLLSVKAILLDKVGGEGMSQVALEMAMDYARGMLEIGVNDLDHIAFTSAAFYDGYRACVTGKIS